MPRSIGQHRLGQLHFQRAALILQPHLLPARQAVHGFAHVLNVVLSAATACAQQFFDRVLQARVGDVKNLQDSVDIHCLQVGNILEIVRVAHDWLSVRGL